MFAMFGLVYACGGGGGGGVEEPRRTWRQKIAKTQVS